LPQSIPILSPAVSQIKHLDRLNWVAGVSFSAYGQRLGIRVNDARILDRLPQYFPFGWRAGEQPLVDRLYSLRVAPDQPDAAIRRFHQLHFDAQRLFRSRDLDEVLDALEWDLRTYTAEWAHRRIFVHAGVVGWRGKAIVIPGRSYSGKSRLVQELVRAGATYYSDEYAVFDVRGRVHPYAKPISIRENGLYAKQTHYPVETLGGRAGVSPLPIGLIVSTRYQSGGSWQARLLTPGQGALELLSNTVAVRRQPEKTLSVLRDAARSAAVIKGRRGEARSVVQSLLTLAEQNTSPALPELLKQQGPVIRRLNEIERRDSAEREAQQAEQALKAKSIPGSRIVRDGIKAGTPAPAFRLPNIHGGTVALDDYRGRRVLLVFSDPNCGPCDSLAPKLARFADRQGPSGPSVLMVSRGDLEDNREKAAKFRIQFPLALQDRWKLSKEYGIFATPVAFLIGEDGVIERNVAMGQDAILQLARDAVKTGQRSVRAVPGLHAGPRTASYNLGEIAG
jgi:peroxiredoxin